MILKVHLQIYLMRFHKLYEPLHLINATGSYKTEALTIVWFFLLVLCGAASLTLLYSTAISAQPKDLLPLQQTTNKQKHRVKGLYLSVIS